MPENTKSQVDWLVKRLAVLRAGSILEVQSTIPNSIDKAQFEKLCKNLAAESDETKRRTIFDRTFMTLSPYARNMVRELLL